MSNVKLDLKCFKHLKSDKHTTTLEHPDGHTITLAHGKLDKPNQEQLKALSKMSSNTKTEAQKIEDPNDKPGRNADVDRQDRPDTGYGKITYKAEGGEVEQQPEVPEYLKPNSAVQQPPPQGMPAININVGGGTPAQAQPEQPPAPKQPSLFEQGASAYAPKQGAQAPVQQEQAQPNSIFNPAPDSIMGKQSGMKQPPSADDIALNAYANDPNAGPQAREVASQPIREKPPMAQEAAGQPAPVREKTAPAPAQTFEQKKAEVHQELSTENQAFEKDLQDGHIEPKTIHSMFMNASVPSKISTVFGMLLAGIGSGLTGQPNTLIQIMQKEIDNDLQAQMNSKSNAQNLYKLNMQHEMQKSQQQQMKVQSGLTSAETRSVSADAKAKAYALTQAQMLQSSYHDLALKTNNMPENTPQEQAKKQAAKQTLGMLYSKMGDKIMNLNDQAAGASAYSGMLSNGMNAGGSDEAQFQDRQRMLRMTGNEKIAQDNEAKRIPGIKGMASVPVPQQIRDQALAMHTLDEKGKDLLSFIKGNTGTWDPKKTALASQKVEELKNFYNSSINGGALTEGRLHWYDEQFKKNPTDRLAQFMGSTEKLKEMIDSNSMRKRLLLKSVGFPDQPESSVPEVKMFQGAKYQKVDGGWKKIP